MHTSKKVQKKTEDAKKKAFELKGRAKQKTDDIKKDNQNSTYIDYLST